jgi:hypothetical protein
LLESKLRLRSKMAMIYAVFLLNSSLDSSRLTSKLEAEILVVSSWDHKS